MNHPKKKSFLRHIVSPLLKGVVSVGLLGFLFHHFGWKQIIAEVDDISWGGWIGAILILHVAQVCSTLRWQNLIEAVGNHLPFSFLFRLYYIGMFFSLCLPTLVGGDAIRWFYLYRKVGRPEASLSSILIDRASGFFILLLFLGIILPFQWASIPQPHLKIACVVIALMAIPMVWIAVQPGFFAKIAVFLERRNWKRISQFIHNFEISLEFYRRKPQALFKALFYSTLIQLMGVLEINLIARSVGLDLPWVSFFLYLPLILVVSMLPITFAGLGVREGFAVYLLGLHGVEPTKVILLSLLWYLSAVAVSLPGVVFYWFQKVPVRTAPPAEIVESELKRELTEQA